MLAFVLGLALAVRTVPSEEPDMVAANSWIQLIDDWRWDDSWIAAGTLFKSQIPQPRWAATVAAVRAPLGTVSSRALKGVTKTRSLPGVPDGHYEVVQFQTSFSNKAFATETIVLSRETAGWKVDGYFIR